MRARASLTLVAILSAASTSVAQESLLPETTDPIEVRLGLYGLLAEASDDVVAEHYAILKADRDRLAGLV